MEEEIKQLIDNAKVDETIVLPQNRYWQTVRFDYRDYRDGEGMKYSWSASKKDFGYSYPFSSNPNLIGVFKTIMGAKRNFLKRYLKLNS